MITFEIKLGNFYPTSLFAEPRLCWLHFILYHRLSWLCFRGGYLPVCLCLIQRQTHAFVTNSGFVPTTLPVGRQK